jgi:hypothetical protein
MTGLYDVRWGRLEVVFDSQDLVEFDSDVHGLNGAVLLHYFDGFMDAGAAGKAGVDHLLATYEHRVIARFDIDDLIDYRARRPAMTYATDQWETYDAPELVVYLMHDSAGTPFALLTGLEPDRRWEAVITAVRTLIERWGIRLSVGFQGIPMGVPHTRPLTVVSHATKSELTTERSHFGRVQVPGNLSALLEFRLGQSGHDAMGFAAYVPHYLAQSVYPAAGLNLLESITKVTGLIIDTAALHDAVSSTNAEIARQVANSEEVERVVEALERQYDALMESEARGDLLIPRDQQLPSADDIAAELEQFLAEHGDR